MNPVKSRRVYLNKYGASVGCREQTAPIDSYFSPLDIVP